MSITPEVIEISPEAIHNISASANKISDNNNPFDCLVRVRLALDTLQRTEFESDKMYVISLYDSTFLTEKEYRAVTRVFEIIRNNLSIDAWVKFKLSSSFRPPDRDESQPIMPPTAKVELYDMSSYGNTFDKLHEMIQENVIMGALFLIFQSTLQLVKSSHSLRDSVYVLHSTQSVSNNQLDIREYLTLDSELLVTDVLEEISQICQKRFTVNSGYWSKLYAGS